MYLALFLFLFPGPGLAYAENLVLPLQGNRAITSADLPQAEEPEFAFRRLGGTEGLSSDSVFCMLQDRNGFVWLGTFAGLDRYDGSKVVSYRPVPGDSGSLSASLVFDLHQGAKGDIWVATDGGGLNRYFHATDSFEHFRHDPDLPDSLGSDRVFAVVDDKEGYIWIGLGGAGLDRLEAGAKTFKHYRSSPEPAKTQNGLPAESEQSGLPSDIVRVLLCDSKGRLWVGTADGLALRNPETDRFEVIPGMPRGTTVRSLHESSDGQIWVGTERMGLYVYGPSKELHVFQHPGLDPAASIRSLCQDESGKLWIGTEDQGIVVLGSRIVVPELLPAQAFSHNATKSPSPPLPRNKTQSDNKIMYCIRDRNDPESLPSNNVRAILLDRSGLIWVATRGGGVGIYNPASSAILRLPSSSLPGVEDTEIRQIIEDRSGRTWIATDGEGLHVLDPHRRLAIAYRNDPRDPSSLPGNRVISLVEDGSGYIWVGTDGEGLARLNPATGRFHRYQSLKDRPGSLGGNVVWALLLDSSGFLWVGLEGAGLDRYDPHSDSFIHYKPKSGASDTLQGFSVRALLEDSRGRFWVGTWDGGLSLLDRETGIIKPIMRNPAASDSLADASVNCLFEDSRHRIWIGTGGGGLDRLVEDKDGTFRFIHLREEDGLASNDIVGVLEDTLRRIWIVTARGLTRYDGPETRPESWAFSDGLQKRYVQNAYCKTSDGRFWLGGGDGLDIINPAELRHNPGAPPVVIADINVIGSRSGTPLDSSRRVRSLRTALADGTVVLYPGDSALVVDFAVLDYTDPQRNRYAFSLQSGRSRWTDLGSSNRAVLTGLAPGEHILRVRGADSGGVWNQEGASLVIKVLPPAWRKPWFLGLVSSLLIIVAVFMVRQRTHALERRARELGELSMHIQDAREEERRAAARDVHDELGQLLTAIKLDLHWLSRHPQEVGRQGRLGESLTLVDDAIASVKRISTRLRPKALDTLSLSEALAWQLDEFMHRTGIECHARIQPAPDGVEPSIGTTLFRIFQEILTNVARHAKASSVHVDFSISENELRLLVEDDGVGINVRDAESATSLGLLGMRERVRYAGGSFSIQKAQSKGTIIEVTLPLQNPAARSK